MNHASSESRFIAAFAAIVLLSAGALTLASQFIDWLYAAVLVALVGFAIWSLSQSLSKAQTDRGNWLVLTVFLIVAVGVFVHDMVHRPFVYQFGLEVAKAREFRDRATVLLAADSRFTELDLRVEKVKGVRVHMSGTVESKEELLAVEKMIEKLQPPVEFTSSVKVTAAKSR